MKAFFFDFDGLLVDTSHLHLAAIKRAMCFFNVRDNDFDMVDGERKGQVS